MYVLCGMGEFSFTYEIIVILIQDFIVCVDFENNFNLRTNVIFLHFIPLELTSDALLPYYLLNSIQIHYFVCFISHFRPNDLSRPQ